MQAFGLAAFFVASLASLALRRSVLISCRPIPGVEVELNSWWVGDSYTIAAAAQRDKTQHAQYKSLQSHFKLYTITWKLFALAGTVGAVYLLGSSG